MGEANKYDTQLIEILFSHGDPLKCLRGSLLCLHLINSSLRKEGVIMLLISWVVNLLGYASA